MLAEALEERARSTSAAAPDCSGAAGAARREGHRDRRFAGGDCRRAGSCGAAGACDRLSRGDVQELEGQFDLITCMEVIEHVADPSVGIAHRGSSRTGC